MKLLPLTLRSPFHSGYECSRNFFCEFWIRQIFGILGISERARPGRELFGRPRPGRELEPGWPFMDLLEKSPEFFQKPQNFWPGMKIY